MAARNFFFWYINKIKNSKRLLTLTFEKMPQAPPSFAAAAADSKHLMLLPSLSDLPTWDAAFAKAVAAHWPAAPVVQPALSKRPQSLPQAAQSLPFLPLAPQQRPRPSVPLAAAQPLPPASGHLDVAALKGTRSACASSLSFCYSDTLRNEIMSKHAHKSRRWWCLFHGGL